jgi:response regulator RpfG family c-di-GMP phosphodiesterase
MTKSAPLHDIGKVGVADRILLKPDKLTDEEFAEMKKHPTLGRDALLRAEQMLGSTSSFLQLAREIAYSHHEKWDGTGYPDGVQGDAIPLPGRIMAIADVYDALISKRCYKPAFSHEKAVEIICEGRGKHFDPDLVDAFVACADEFREIASRFKDDHSH